MFIVDKSVNFLRRLLKALGYNFTFVYGLALANLCFLTLSIYLTYSNENNSIQVDLERNLLVFWYYCTPKEQSLWL